LSTNCEATWAAIFPSCRDFAIYNSLATASDNDTTPRYDEAAAKEAWQRTPDWFNKYLKA
jgi:dienelactone hydrolase